MGTIANDISLAELAEALCKFAESIEDALPSNVPKPEAPPTSSAVAEDLELIVAQLRELVAARDAEIATLRAAEFHRVIDVQGFEGTITFDARKPL